MEVNNLANIKSAIKRAELNVKQNEKTQLKNQLCVLQSKLSKQTHLKNFSALLAQLSIKQKLRFDPQNKASRDKARLQLNLLNKKQSIEAAFLSQIGKGRK